MQWCMQCGTENQPRLAVGMDDEGEPACVAHKVKTFEEINRGTPREAKPVAVQPETSKPMNRVNPDEMRQCPGVLGKPCDVLIGPRKEVCGKCYARRLYHQGKNGATKPKVKAKPAKKFVGPEAIVDVSIPLGDSPLATLKARLQLDLAAVEAVERLLGSR